jgi:hypothetical protein
MALCYKTPLCIITIITGKTTLFQPQLFLEDSARFDPVFTALDFVIVMFFKEQGHQPCVQPLPGELGLCTYVPQRQGGPGTGFPFRRHLRLAGLRWRYSNPPPHGVYYISVWLKIGIADKF